MSDMIDSNGYRRTGGMVAMSDLGSELLLELRPQDEARFGDVGSTELFAMIDRLPDDLPVFVRNVFRYEDRVRAALATWWGEHRDSWSSWGDAAMSEVQEAADEAMSHLAVRQVLRVWQAQRACPDCGGDRQAQFGFGRVFWSCSPCEWASQDKALAEWLEGVDREWEARALDMVGEVHWPEQYPVIPAVEQVLNGQHCGAYLFGAPGTGKTQQAAEYVRQVLTRNRKQFTFRVAESFRFTSAPFPSVLAISEVDLLASLKGGGANPPEHKIERYIDVKYLAIDDIGTVKSSEFNYASLYQIINARFTAKRATVFTSNYALPELRQKGLYDERITQRIFEMCGGRQAHAAGELGLVELAGCHRMPAGEEVLW